MSSNDILDFSPEQIRTEEHLITLYHTRRLLLRRRLERLGLDLKHVVDGLGVHRNTVNGWFKEDRIWPEGLRNIEQWLDEYEFSEKGLYL